MKISSGIEIFKRAVPNPYFLWGILEVRDWNFRARLKNSSEIEIFDRDWIFSIAGNLRNGAVCPLLGEIHQRNMRFLDSGVKRRGQDNLESSLAWAAFCQRCLPQCPWPTPQDCANNLTITLPDAAFSAPRFLHLWRQKRHASMEHLEFAVRGAGKHLFFARQSQTSFAYTDVACSCVRSMQQRFQEDNNRVEE